MTTGERIKKIRKQLKISQKELAQRSGVSIATIQGYEQGKYNTPKLETLERIANALQVDISEIDGREKYVIQVFHPHNLAEAVKKTMTTKHPEKAGVFTADYAPDLKTLDLIQKRNRGDHLTEEEIEQLVFYDDTRIQENAKMLNTFRHAQLLTAFNQLNEDGQDKAVEQVELLTMIPEYQKNEGQE